MNERLLLKCARVLSSLFSPFYMTLVVFACILLHGLKRLLYVGYVPSLLGYVVLLFMVTCFTAVIPLASISVFRRVMRLSRGALSQRRNRAIPYVMTILSYLACTVMLSILNVPAYLQGSVVAALVTLMLCAVINMWWKVSVHMAALGGVTAALGVCGVVMNFNPLWHMCLLFLISGVVGTSRMILRQHTLSQILWGFGLGVACSTLFMIRGFLKI